MTKHLRLSLRISAHSKILLSNMYITSHFLTRTSFTKHRFARSEEPLYGYAIVGEKTGERIIMYGYLLPYPILIYICIELFDEMQAQRFSAVALLLNRYQLLSFSLLNAVIQADMQKFLIRCKDNTTRTQNQTCPGFSGGVRRP